MNNQATKNSVSRPHHDLDPIAEVSTEMSGEGSRLDGISENSGWSSVLSGQVASQASSIKIKESKIKLRAREITLLTPPIVYPVGFCKAHPKQVLRYNSEQCLHLQKWPAISPSVGGGIIINLDHERIEE